MRKALYMIAAEEKKVSPGVFETIPAGTVVNVIVLEDGANWQPPNGCAVVDAELDGGPDDIWDGSKFQPTPTSEPSKAWWQK